MELWIRSQNKRMLTKLDYCYLEPVHKREILGGNHYLINQSLGIYPTEKRALEVLQEIHQRIIDLQSLSYFNINDIKRFPRNLDCVYEMPNE